MLRTYRTPKGTDLPLLNLRGKEYLEVKYRLVWFREDHNDWAIETELLSVTDQSAYARATVKDEQGRVIATSHKFETRQGFPDFIEKAETGAIGRALALIGYGTQFCADELDEGSRIVDAPVSRSRTQAAAKPGNKIVREEDRIPTSLKAEAATAKPSPGDYTVSFGKKYKGQKLRDIPRAELEGYLEWLEESAQKNGQPLSEEARHLKTAAGRFLQTANR
jgi:hypothetical protein